MPSFWKTKTKKKMIKTVEPGQLSSAYIFRSKDSDEQTKNMFQPMKFQSHGPQKLWCLRSKNG